ncbi:hypothetical protein C8J57DRAFT_1629081 [Mycena rebaudengoi]|nr:hypothetical protein C8J57DRAFT_1629081 [Mycena rebaudengoi]
MYQASTVSTPCTPQLTVRRLSRGMHALPRPCAVGRGDTVTFRRCSRSRSSARRCCCCLPPVAPSSVDSGNGISSRSERLEMTLRIRVSFLEALGSATGRATSATRLVTSLAPEVISASRAHPMEAFATLFGEGPREWEMMKGQIHSLASAAIIPKGPAQIRWRSATAALRVTSPCAAELSGAELRNICRRADNSYYRFRGPPCAPPCALRPTSPAHLRTACPPAPNLPCAPAHLRTALRTCAQPPCAPALRSFPHWRSASRKRSLHAPNFPAHLRLTPAHLRSATSQTGAPHQLPTCRQLHPSCACALALNPCAPALRNFPDRSSASVADLPTAPPLMRLRPLSRTCPEHMRPTHPAAIPDAPPAHSTARPASYVTRPPRTSPRPLTARQLPHAAAPFHTPTP